MFKTSIRLPGTSLSSTIWQSVATALGPAAVREEIETHERWARREYTSYLDWMKDTIEIHRRYGLHEQVFRSIIDEAQYNDGVAETLRCVDRSVYEIVLISGGFRELAERVQRDFSIPHAFAACEYLFDAEGMLAAYNLLPCDFHGKIDFIRLMLREYGLDSSSWMFVGDGANDAPIAEAAPLSVAYGKDAHLRQVATHAIDSFSELLPLLRAFAASASAVRVSA